MGNKPSAAGETGSKKSKSAADLIGGDLLQVIHDIKAEKSESAVKSGFDQVWSRYDTDGNGYLDTDEGTQFVMDFMKVLAKCKRISYEQLVSDLAMDPETGIRRSENEVIRLFFALVDCDDDGMITREEFETYIRNYLPF